MQSLAALAHFGRLLVQMFFGVGTAIADRRGQGPIQACGGKGDLALAADGITRWTLDRRRWHDLKGRARIDEQEGRQEGILFAIHPFELPTQFDPDGGTIRIVGCISGKAGTGRQRQRGDRGQQGPAHIALGIL